MSSFRRREPVQSASEPSSSDAATSRKRHLLQGTRPCPHNSSALMISSGVPSLDDVIGGGGVPLGTVTTYLTPDVHSAWGTLLQRYFIAQGLFLGQRVCIVAPSKASGRSLVNGCMWTGASSSGLSDNNDSTSAAAAQEDTSDPGAKIKIAWRYENMKHFETTVQSGSSDAAEGYASNFDLTKTIPSDMISQSMAAGQLLFIDPSTYLTDRRSVFQQLQNNADDSQSRVVTRIAVPALGSADWGDLSPQDILSFLYLLRAKLRSSNASAFVTLPPILSLPRPSFWKTPRDASENDDWYDKVSTFSDTCLLFSSFGSDPALETLFRTYHGAVQVLRASVPQALTAPSHKYSTLRGLSSTSSASSGENNLAFRCTRKRFLVETLHLDAEGGVGERRTTKPIAMLDDPLSLSPSHSHSHSQSSPHSESNMNSQTAPVQISLEPQTGAAPGQPAAAAPALAPKKKSAFKKRVAFQSDRPDLYDF